MRVLLLLIPLAGCATSQLEVFRLSTGELITCNRYAQRECGMNIRECGEEASVEFDCLQDVHYVGRLGVPKKKRPCEGPDGKPTCPPDYVGDEQ